MPAHTDGGAVFSYTSTCIGVKVSRLNSIMFGVFVTSQTTCVQGEKVPLGTQVAAGEQVVITLDFLLGVKVLEVLAKEK